MGTRRGPLVISGDMRAWRRAASSFRGFFAFGLGNSISFVGGEGYRHSY